MLNYTLTTVILIILLLGSMHTKILIDFGHNISILRRRKGMTQEGLAMNSGLHRTHIGMIERAERDVTLTSISKLAKGLEVSINELFRF
jgi:transcriptional regulator with XRE-family HTH domain